MTRQGEQGTVTAFVTCLTIALLAVGGLVIDGGYTLAARRRAFNEANAAARSGAQAVDEAAIRAGEPPRIQPARARTLAMEHLRTAGLDGTVDATGDRVTVHVTTTQQMTILGLVGVGPLTIRADGSARAVKGVKAGDN